jgi:hypothetical protein
MRRGELGSAGGASGRFPSGSASGHPMCHELRVTCYDFRRAVLPP